MTRDEFLETVAKLVAGLQAPVSLRAPVQFSAAMGPWQALLHQANHGFGWTNAEELKAAFERILDGESEDSGSNAQDQAG